mmetsp:Transcript_56703/g.132525  ORF Transcript_56703/g.132525 Transcript_56703/m.132525 type:complete len:352 (-) Transcript_56703:105-1160(-)
MATVATATAVPSAAPCAVTASTMRPMYATGGNGSFVPAATPQVPVSTSYAPQMMVPQAAASVNLTEGIPDPDSIEQQKRAYERGLDAELEQTRRLAEEQLKQQKAAIKAQAEQQLAMYKAQVDQSIRQQELSLDHQWQQQQMELQQAFLKQKAALEQQASSLAMEYQQRKMHEELLRKQADMQREMQEMQRRMHMELHEHQTQQANLQQQHAVQRQQHQEELAAQQAKYLQTQAQIPGAVYAAPMTSSFAVPAPAPIAYQGTLVPPATAVAPQVPEMPASAPQEPLVVGSVQHMPTYPDLLNPVQTYMPAAAGAMGGGLVAPATTCANCGASFLPDAQFCRKCGVRRPGMP